MTSPATPDAGVGETIFALSSGSPPAGVAVIRTSGPAAHLAAVAFTGALPPPRRAALRTFRDPGTGKSIDRLLLLRFDGPELATGEDVVEYQCHGGRAVVRAMLEALGSHPGLRLAEPGEFTRRALANGRIDLIEAGGLAELLAAETELQRRAAQSRASGAVSEMIEQWRERLLAIAATAEVAIDYADEEDGAAAPTIAGAAAALADDIRMRLAAPRLDRLRDGFRIVLAGPPNSGKSSLLNALTQSARAIVTPIPGTTRNSIEVPIAHGGLPLVLVDTAGLRDSVDPVERLGIKRARDELALADLVLWLGRDDPADGMLALSSKADLDALLPGRLAVSSETGEGLDELWRAIHVRLADRVPATGDLIVDQREAALLSDACGLLHAAAAASDPIVASEEVAAARGAFDRLTGRAGIDELLDALFGRFCLGK